MRRLALVCTAVTIWLATAAASAAPRYAVTILPLLPTGISNKGHIVGTWTRPHSKVTTGVLYRNGKVTDLDPKDIFSTPDVPYGRKGLMPTAVNDRDEIVGYRVTSGAVTAEHPFFWARGKIRGLDGTGGWHGGEALDLNNKGQIAGYTDTGNSEDQGDDALYWPSAGVIAKNLGEKMKWRHSDARAINNRGAVVGYWIDTEHVRHPYLLSNGHVTDLGRVSPDCKTNNYAVAVSDAQQVVGYCCDDKTMTSYVFLWQNGRIANLGLMDGRSATPYGINNHGQIVGRAGDSAFLWTDGRFWDLNDLLSHKSGIAIQDALAINDRGEIVAMGIWKGKEAGFLLRPVRAAALKTKCL